MINRRRVLLGGLAAVGVLGVGGWQLGRVLMRAEIPDILRRRLSFLKLDEAGVRTFAIDQTDAAFHKKIPTYNRLRYHLFADSSASYKRFFRAPAAGSRMAHLEDKVVSTYLLSSDFFLNGADESKVVHYVGYYDPLHPCQNPFARRVITPPAVAT